MRTKIDETGNVYGRLTVLEKVSRPEDRKKRGIYWLCQCECGNRPVVLGIGLRADNNKSCGCLHTYPPGVASANRVREHYIAEAKRKGLVWNLSEEEFLDITQENCVYCGIEPSREAAYHNATSGYIYNGIDRIDNTRGYILDNVVPCCSECNWSKREQTVEEFLSWIKRVYGYNFRPNN